MEEWNQNFMKWALEQVCNGKGAIGKREHRGTKGVNKEGRLKVFSEKKIIFVRPGEGKSM